MSGLIKKVHLLEYEEHEAEDYYFISLKVPAKLYKKFRSFLIKMGCLDKRGAKNV